MYFAFVKKHGEPSSKNGRIYMSIVDRWNFIGFWEDEYEMLANIQDFYNKEEHNVNAFSDSRYVKRLDTFHVEHEENGSILITTNFTKFVTIIRNDKISYESETRIREIIKVLQLEANTVLYGTNGVSL